MALASACEASWPTLGFGPDRNGNNPFESTVGVGNVSQLAKAWSSTALVGGPGGTSPVVAGGSVFLTAGGQLLAIDAAGTRGCSGSPVVCKPMWTATQGGSLSPTVAGNLVYTTSAGSLYAFDAHGRTGCSGTPKVCSPLWRASIGGDLGSPAVAGGTLFVGSNNPNRLFAFDAEGGTGCAGSPKVCQPLWRSKGPAGRTPAVSDGVVYANTVVDDGNGPRLVLSAFDAAGSDGCSGAPKTCAPRWKFSRETVCTSGSCAQEPPSVAGGRVHVIEHDCCSNATSSTRVLVVDAATHLLQDSAEYSQSGNSFPRGPVAVAGGRVFLGDEDLVAYGVPGLVEQWRGWLPFNLSSPSVANGVVYAVAASPVGLPASVKLAAFAYASGQGDCTSGTPRRCRPLWTGGPGTIYDLSEVAQVRPAPPIVVNGTVFVRLDRLYAFRVPGT
jgi:outer membrane protein assembly factor BamB